MVDSLAANLPGASSSAVRWRIRPVRSLSATSAVYRGREVAGIRLAFAGGVVVDASAESNGLPPDQTLDIDEARRLWELGVGCN
jgi:hypothetical protein